MKFSRTWLFNELIIVFITQALKYPSATLSLNYGKDIADRIGWTEKAAVLSYNALVRKGLFIEGKEAGVTFYVPTGLFRLLEDMGPKEMWRLVQ